MTEDQQRIVSDLIRRYRGSVREGVDPAIIFAGMIADGWSVAAVKKVKEAVQDG